MKDFKVVIIGRPNTGKSTLFNRIIGRKKAVVHQTPGTTRDVLWGEGKWRRKKFTILDTGGIEPKTKTELERNIQEQIDLAIKEADLILFLVNIKTGPIDEDFLIAKKVQKIKKPIILALNKADSPKLEFRKAEFYKLGLGEPQIISGLTGRGVGDLLDEIVSYIKKEGETEEKRRKIKVGILGKPNVGKSSLLNAILGKTKVIVSEMPGTTRDTIDTIISYKNQPITLIDTAGIKRKTRIKAGLEKFSIAKSLEIVKQCDIILLVIDITEKISRQDLRIANYILKNKKSVILVLNKWDLIEKGLEQEKKLLEMEKYIKYFQSRFNFLFWSPLIFVSAKKGTNIKNVLDLILECAKNRERRLSQKDLRNFYSEVIAKSPPPKMKNQKKKPKIKKIIQERTAPPRFVLLVGKDQVIPPFYFSFLEKRIRERFNFNGTPIEIIQREL